MTSILQPPSVASHDELDLLSLLRAVWAQKKIIFGTSVLSASLAMAYAYFVVPEYEVSTTIRPVAINDLDELNRSKIYSLPPSKALSRVGAVLDSYEARLDYFKTDSGVREAFVRPGRTFEQAFEEFNQRSLSLERSETSTKQQVTDYVSISMRYPKSIIGKDVLNGFVKYSIEKERKQISNDLKVIVSNRLKEVDSKLAAAREDYDTKKNGKIASLLEQDNLKRSKLNDELRALRVQLKIRREARISQLNEAIAIAQALGLQKPTTPSAMSQNNNESSVSIIKTEVNNQAIPLYFMGVEALEAERNVLKHRASDDFVDSRIAQIRKELLLLENNREVQVLQQRKNDELFIKGVEDLRAERARLLTIDTEMENLQLVKVDREAIEPLNPITPAKGMLFIIGLLFGALIGSTIAIVRHLFRLDDGAKSLTSLVSNRHAIEMSSRNDQKDISVIG